MDKFKRYRTEKMLSGVCGYSGCNRKRVPDRALCRLHLKIEVVRSRHNRLSKRLRIHSVSQSPLQDLCKPLSEIEVAELLRAASIGLADKGLLMLRRLMFERDRLKAEAKLMEEVLDALPPTTRDDVIEMLHTRRNKRG